MKPPITRLEKQHFLILNFSILTTYEKTFFSVHVIAHAQMKTRHCKVTVLTSHVQITTQTFSHLCGL